MSGAGVDTASTRPSTSCRCRTALDQFLAITLTTGVVLQVVTDPQKADAIFTDRIGAAFEQKLDEMYGAQAQEPGRSKDAEIARRAMQADLARGKGAIFLVDRKTRNVIWSDYERRQGLLAGRDESCSRPYRRAIGEGIERQVRTCSPRRFEEALLYATRLHAAQTRKGVGDSRTFRT